MSPGTTRDCAFNRPHYKSFYLAPHGCAVSKLPLPFLHYHQHAASGKIQAGNTNKNLQWKFHEEVTSPGCPFFALASTSVSTGLPGLSGVPGGKFQGDCLLEVH
jgi:hypothetical protein